MKIPINLIMKISIDMVMDETWGGGGGVRFQKLAMSKSFQQMACIDDTIIFESVLHGDVWEFECMRLKISILYDRQGD